MFTSLFFFSCSKPCQKQGFFFSLFINNMEITDLLSYSPRERYKTMRQYIKEAWRNRCAYCGVENALTLDHVVPKHKGGHTVEHNLVLCCNKCNGSKGSRDWQLWYLDQDFFDIERHRNILSWIDFQYDDIEEC